MQLEASEERIEGLESTSAAHGEGTEKTYRRNTTRCKEDAAIVGRIFLVVRDVRYQTLNVETDSFSSGGFLQTLHRAFEKPLVIGLCPQSRIDKYCAHLCTTYWIYCARFCKGVVCWTMMLLRYRHYVFITTAPILTCHKPPRWMSCQHACRRRGHVQSRFCSRKQRIQSLIRDDSLSSTINPNDVCQRS